MKNLNKANKVITYTVSKVRDTKDMYISVQNGEVEIIAPLNYPNKKIQQIMSEKREWILSKIAEYNFNNLDNSNGIERNPVKILGKNFKMKINYKNIKVAELNVIKDEIKISLSNKYKGKDNKKILKLAIDKLYESIAPAEIERAMERFRIMFGFAPEDYKIEKLSHGYGNCKNNIITIDKIIMEQFLKLKVKKSKKIRVNL